MKHQFKDPSAQIVLIGGEVVHAGNLTEEKYEQLINLSPAHADQFEVVKEKEPVKAAAK